MSRMKRVDLFEMFTAPDNYKPPEVHDLTNNTNYPNLNSLEYMHKPIDDKVQIQKFYELLITNEKGNILLACNDYTSRVWNGSFWGFETIADFGQIEKSSYRLQCKAPITNAEFVEPNILLVTDALGTVELWSTQADVRKSQGYCLFNIGHQTEHSGIVNTMEICRADKKIAITGSNDYCLKQWDMGAGDLQSINTYRFAHSDSITGISTNPINPSLFITCSRDKSFLIWDQREISKPVVQFNDQYEFGYTAVRWSGGDDLANGGGGGENEQIFLGDETGKMCIYDIRNIDECLQSVQAFDTPIHKFRFKNGDNKFACLAQSNVVKIYEIESSGQLQLYYQNSDAEDFVRDVLWNEDLGRVHQFHTVGWSNGFVKHIM